MWELRETAEFEKEYQKLPLDIRKRFENQFKKLQENPYGIGKPLSYPWFRELKNDKFRAYYLIYDQLIMVLFVGISDKKAQQISINTIKMNFQFFKEMVGKSNKMIIKEKTIEYGMDKEIQKLIEERDLLAQKVCQELLSLEGITHD